MIFHTLNTFGGGSGGSETIMGYFCKEYYA
jgi:hypothetical protein